MNQFKLIRCCRCNSCDVKLRILRLFAFVAAAAIFGYLDLRSAHGQSGCPCGCGGVGGCSLLSRAVTTAPTAAIDARIGGRFSATATDGSTGSSGDAATFTWGIAADGTTAPVGVSGAGQSNLVSFLDGIRDPASPGGADLTQRSWFALFEQSTNRIAELSGASFVYEPDDDGSTLGEFTPAGDFVFSPDGQAGVRADIRIGGGDFDGVGGNVAVALGADVGEVIFDTADGEFFSNTVNDSRSFRNTLTHELYHSLGILHVETDFVEPNLLTPSAALVDAFIDGPQLDDILTLQRNYGDVLEGDNGQVGNDTIATATQLGLLAVDNALSAGQEVDDSRIGIDEVGFLSIDNEDDVDVFEFSVGVEATIALELNPEGATYSQAVEFGTPTDLNSLELNDLTLRVLDASGDLVATSSAFGLGESELIVETLAAGRYFAEVSGELDGIQLFTLNISAVAVPEPSSAGILICSLVALQFRRRRK